MIGESRPTSKHWIERTKSAALLGAVAAAAISGYAFAISPTVDTGREFAGAVTFFNAGLGGTHAVYTVPAGQQYTLTDIVVSNASTTPSNITVAVGDVNCAVTNARTHAVLVPREDTLHLPFLTGIGVGAGKTVCVTIGPVSMALTLRGYLSNGA